jgi:hypothetical protein
MSLQIIQGPGGVDCYMAALQALHMLAGFIVLAEALNKLERTAPFAAGLSMHRRVVDGLKALAWLLLALGAGGALAAPVLLALGVHPDPSMPFARLEKPTVAEVLVLTGFATLIVRTRIKEG